MGRLTRSQSLPLDPVPHARSAPSRGRRESLKEVGAGGVKLGVAGYFFFFFFVGETGANSWFKLILGWESGLFLVLVKNPSQRG